MIAYIKLVKSGQQLPQVRQEIVDGALRVTSDRPFIRAVYWHAVNPKARDFRILGYPNPYVRLTGWIARLVRIPLHWRPFHSYRRQVLSRRSGHVATAPVDKIPAGGFGASFIELCYKDLDLTVTSQIWVRPSGNHAR